MKYYLLTRKDKKGKPFTEKIEAKDANAWVKAVQTVYNIEELSFKQYLKIISKK